MISKEKRLVVSELRQKANVPGWSPVASYVQR